MAREERTREEIRIVQQQAREDVQQAMTREERTREDARAAREGVRQSIAREEHAREEASYFARKILELTKKLVDMHENGFPLVFKIVEGQEGLHIDQELKKLRALGCEELVTPKYYANDITLRGSVRKRIDDWILEQINAGDGVDSDHFAGDYGQYVRYGVFVFCVYNRAISIRRVRDFFNETVQSLQTTPSEDFQPLADQALTDRTSRYLDHEQE
ncbi:hypothetical protein PF010_g21332 [Phytophthora fragariae]|uniref:Uncharacterized protein n=1 Tax=Phytophthora fragariae TaxID=53985 RepID=A0A6G0KCK3_9STRA|nr:hypothetical protein PF010_g21332 [Phytophthora fragariae]KAE9221452.1 hypothetical protein PF004_g13043 [Phytophthora fragariae]